MLEDERVAGVLSISSQVPLRPPHDGVPSERDRDQPFQPAQHEVASLDVSQLVRQDPAQLGIIDLRSQRLWQDHAYAASAPPGHGCGSSCRDVDRGDRAHVELAGHDRSHVPDAGRRRPVRAPLGRSASRPGQPSSDRFHSPRAALQGSRPLGCVTEAAGQAAVAPGSCLARAIHRHRGRRDPGHRVVVLAPDHG